MNHSKIETLEPPSKKGFPTSILLGLKALAFLFSMFNLHFCYAQFNTDRLVMIGRSALYYEDYVLSIQYFNQAISQKPWLYEPWFFRGVAKYYLDDYHGAETDCSEAIERNPYVVSAYEVRALCRINQKNFPGAVEDYDRALRYDPENQLFWYNRVLCLVQNKDYDNIIRCLDRVENIEGASEQTALSKMHIYSLKGEKDKELQVLEDLVKKHPNDMNYRVMKGNWLIQNGMHEEAFEEYQFALRQDPKHVAARLSLLDYYRTLDKDSLANALQEDILESPEIPTNDKVMLVRKVVAENEQNGADSTQVLDLFNRVLSKPQHSADMTAMYAAYLQMKNFPQDSINTV